MTAQIPDSVSLTHAGEHDSWTLAEAHGHGLYTPERYGQLLGMHVSTDCWRGFIAHYQVDDEQLWLPVGRQLLDRVLEARRNGDVSAFGGTGRPEVAWNDDGTPTIVLPDPAIPEQPLTVEWPSPDRPRVLIHFSGKLVVGRDFIEELYVHGGFPAPWKFEQVLVLGFEDGRLTEVAEVSEEARRVRELNLRISAEVKGGARSGQAAEEGKAEVYRALRHLQRAYSIERDLGLEDVDSTQTPN